MKFILAVLAIMSFSLTSQAKDEFAIFKQLTGIYHGADCVAEIRDLEFSNPENYAINFPEWKYQIILEKDGKFIHEAILNELLEDEVEIRKDVVIVDASKKDFFTTHFQFVIELRDQKVSKVTLEKKIPVIGWVKKAVCNLK